jgi:hypothetical protein
MNLPRMIADVLVARLRSIHLAGRRSVIIIRLLR